VPTSRGAEQHHRPEWCRARRISPIWALLRTERGGGVLQRSVVDIVITPCVVVISAAEWGLCPALNGRRAARGMREPNGKRAAADQKNRRSSPRARTRSTSVGFERTVPGPPARLVSRRRARNRARGNRLSRCLALRPPPEPRRTVGALATSRSGDGLAIGSLCSR
jgi:hypothetical protein